MPKHDFEGVSVSILKQYFGISVAICNYIHTCAEKKRKKRLHLSASIQREAKYYTGLPSMHAHSHVLLRILAA